MRKTSLLGLLCVVLMFVFSAGSAIGAVSILFSSGENTITDHLGDLLSAERMFIVYWTADASTSGFNVADPLSPLDGDLIMMNGAEWWFDTSAGPNTDGRITGNNPLNLGTGTSEYSPGYCYIAVFEIDYSTYTGGAIPHETFYGLGPISGSLTQQYPEPATPNQYGSLIDLSPIVTDQQVNVPEPTTMALMAVGALALAGMRRRKSPDIV